MEQNLSYVLVTPYTVAKSRIGGVISRLLSRVDLELVGAQMIAPDDYFAKAYADVLKGQTDQKKPEGAILLGNYIEKNLGPSGGRAHRSLLLLFSGENPCRKLSDICGALYSENRSVESMTGETIRDTYADMIFDSHDPKKIAYFEPAILTPREQRYANQTFELLSRWLPNQPNIVENMLYPEHQQIERTLVILKPDNWKFASLRPGTIIDMFSRTGLRIIGIKIHRMSINEAMEFYQPVEQSLKERLAPVLGKKAKELLEKEFTITLSNKFERLLIDSFGTEYAQDQFQQIIEFMAGARPESAPIEQMNQPGPVKCMILIYEGEDAVKKIRDVLGPTDPLKAPGGTIRREFGSNIMVNTAHASLTVENANREMGIVRFYENNCAEIIKSYLSLHQ